MHQFRQTPDFRVVNFKCRIFHLSSYVVHRIIYLDHHIHHLGKRSDHITHYNLLMVHIHRIEPSYFNYKSFPSFWFSCFFLFY